MIDLPEVKIDSLEHFGYLFFRNPAMVLASKLGNLCWAHPLRQTRENTANLPISNIGVYKATETYHANTTPLLVLGFNPSEKY
jgi:hypothetical protein